MNEDSPRDETPLDDGDICPEEASANGLLDKEVVAAPHDIDQDLYFFFSHDVMLHLSHTFCSQECIPSSALSNI